MTSGKGLKVAALCLLWEAFLIPSPNSSGELAYLSAHNAVVTSAIFAPHPILIVPQETGAEKPEADCKSLDSTDSETIPSGMLTDGIYDIQAVISVLENVRVPFRRP